MRSLLRILIASACIAVLPLLAGAKLMARIPLDRVGVLEHRWGDGIEARDHGPGFHPGVPGLHSWHLLDRTWSFLTFAGEDAVGGESGSLGLRTRDNNTVHVDVAVPYRIRPGLAHRIVADGFEQVYPARVRSTVENVLRSELATLRSEDWFRPETRRERLDAILPLVNRALEELHVEARDVLVQDVRFSADYEHKLQETQISYQHSLLNDAKREVEDAEAQFGKYTTETEALEKQLRAERDKALEQLRADSARELTEIEARTKLFDARTHAEADRAHEALVSDALAELGRIEVEGEQRRMRALGTPEGRLWLAHRAAKGLGFGEVVLNSNDPRVPSLLQIDELVRALTGRVDQDTANEEQR